MNQYNVISVYSDQYVFLRRQHHPSTDPAIHSSHIDDFSRFLIILKRLKTCLAEQLVTGRVTNLTNLEFSSDLFEVSELDDFVKLQAS